MVLVSFAGNSIGLMAGCLIRDVKAANGILPLFITVFVQFGGFYKNQDNYMPWIKWISFISPIKYSFESAVLNEFAERN